MLFLEGVSAAATDSGASILAGGAIGLLAGAALGVIVYRGLLRIALRWFFSVTSALLLLFAAGLASQMAKLLIQGDFVPAPTSRVGHLGAAVHRLASGIALQC